MPETDLDRPLDPVEDNPLAPPDKQAIWSWEHRQTPVTWHFISATSMYYSTCPDPDCWCGGTT